MSESSTPVEEQKQGTSRRTFLKVLGAAGATTAAIGCSSNTGEKLIPYLVQPDETVPGVSNYYASTCRECAAGCGVLLEVRDGRTFKVEGNPDHPLNRGALCSRGQATVQGLYNPGSLSPADAPKEWQALADLVDAGDPAARAAARDRAERGESGVRASSSISTRAEASRAFSMRGSRATECRRISATRRSRTAA